MLLLTSLTFSLLLDSAFCYKQHNALNSIIFTTNPIPAEDVHSEYYFGKCASQEKVLVEKHVFTYEDIKNSIVVRAQLNVDKEPSCVYIRARSGWSEIIRYHAFKFNICVCQLVYNYGGTVYTHFYYEWYIPVEMMKEINWEIYFYE